MVGMSGTWLYKQHLFLTVTAGAPLSADKRRQWCDIPKNLAGRLLDTEYIWTFHIWQHLIDFSTYKLSVGGFVNLDLTHALNCQPLQLTCKDTKVRDTREADV